MYLPHCFPQLCDEFLGSDVVLEVRVGPPSPVVLLCEWSVWLLLQSQVGSAFVRERKSSK